MSLPDSIDVTLCVRLVQTLGHFIWQGTAVFVLLWFALSLMRNGSSRARYCVSLLALILTVACPVITFVLMGQDGPHPVVTSGRSLDSLGMPGGARLPVPAMESPAVGEPPASHLDWRRYTPHVDWRRYAPHVALLYLGGLAIMLGRLLLALHGGRRLRRRSQPVEDPRILRTLARQAKALGLSFTPAIACCRRIVVPTVVGVVFPMILLPISLTTGLSREQIEILLAHELAHIRRYDHFVNILQRVVEAVLFFHPCVWLISRRVRLEREYCCDDLVLAVGVEDLTYAGSLCRIAEIALTLRDGQGLAAVAAVGAGGRPSQLRQRILRVIGSPAHNPARLAVRSNFVLILVGLATTLAAIQFVASGSSSCPDGLATEAITNGEVYILGQVKQPGVCAVSGTRSLTLTQLISAAGGYNGSEPGHAEIMLSRVGADGRRCVACKVDLNALTQKPGNDVTLRNGDLVTLSGEEVYRPNYTVRLVVGGGRMTFQGQEVTWDNLRGMLESLPNRPYTVFSVAKAEDDPPTDEQFNAAQRYADEFVATYGFEGRNVWGPRPLGDHPTCVQYVPVESMHYGSGETIAVNDSLLRTHTATPPGRPQHAVRLVIGAHCMTFQGQEVGWERVPGKSYNGHR